ncbi:MAG TPA: hypothetical protein VEX86_01415 [Longimicrobium sp.]|nr:hypothetical protein [Longimicrobium sp.]
MIGDIDYASHWRQYKERRDALRGELHELETMMRAYAPLAARYGVRVDVDAPGLLSVEAPVTTDSEAVAESTPLAQATEGPDEETDQGPDVGGPAASPASAVYAHGITAPDAALHVMWSRPSAEWPTPAVADALLDGGFPSTSTNFRVNIYTSMKRLRARGLVERVGGGVWVLTERGCDVALEVAERLENNESTADVGASAADSEEALMLDRGNPSLGV